MTTTVPFRRQDAPNLTAYCEECGATKGEHVCTLAAGHDGLHMTMLADGACVFWSGNDSHND